MADASSPEPRPRGRKRKALWTGLLLLVLAVVAAVVWAYAPAVNERLRTSDVEGDVRQARERGEARVDEVVERRSEFLLSSGIVKDEIARSEVDACYLNHDDSGFTARNWYQYCYMRVVVGYSTSLDKNAVAQRVADAPSSLELGSPQAPTKADEPCLEFRHEDRPVALYRPADAPAQPLAPARGECAIPDQLNEPIFTIHGPIVLEEDLAIVSREEFDPAGLEQGSAQLWVTYDLDYYHEKLGCAGLVYCESPRKQPITG